MHFTCVGHFIRLEDIDRDWCKMAYYVPVRWLISYDCQKFSGVNINMPSGQVFNHLKS